MTCFVGKIRLQSQIQIIWSDILWFSPTHTIAYGFRGLSDTTHCRWYTYFDKYWLFRYQMCTLVSWFGYRMRGDAMIWPRPIFDGAKPPLKIASGSVITWYKCICTGLFIHALNARLCITMTSKWARWRLKSPASRLFTQPFIQAQIKENIKAPRHRPLCDRWIPHTNGQ